MRQDREADEETARDPNRILHRHSERERCAIEHERAGDDEAEGPDGDYAAGDRHDERKRVSNGDRNVKCQPAPDERHDEPVQTKRGGREHDRRQDRDERNRRRGHQLERA